MKLRTWFFFMMIMGACKDKYMPQINQPLSGFLVAEGYINAGNDSTFIYLSRSSGLDSIQVFPETAAHVEVQSEQGASYPLAEQSGGKYGIEGLPIDPTQKYRIHIRTSNGKEYLSDFSEVKITPPIDSVSWKAGPVVVTIYVSTHDDQKKSIYYQWSYEETWQYNPPYVSNYIYDPQNPKADSFFLVPRLNGADFRTCWLSSQSSDINLSSTTSLNADVVSEFPLQTISYDGSNRLVTRYSILVKQIALSKDAYEWKQKLKKNTEQLGSIFDAQPSETGGNLHCITDPEEEVIGFIGCSSQTVKRIFINRYELPDVYVTTSYEVCTVDSVPREKEGNAFGDTTYEWVIDHLYKGNDIIGATGAPKGCIDCRLKGGVNVKPSFW
ncbi:MAG TPA: DUF4249 domain-containing protein [Puia sp.]|nr:DUF4249 domain-containing protein [Puia sp.]